MKKLALAMLALPLSGCISFAPKPPPSMLMLRSDAQVPIAQTQNSGAAATITINVPSVTQEIATARVPVRASDTSVAYLKNGQWVEAPQRLFARLLVDTVTARTGRVVLSTRQSMLDPGAELTGELRDFGLDAGTHQAVVVFDATLLRGKGVPAFEKRRFEARVPVAAIDAASAGPALSQAANQVAGQVADWIGK